MDQCVNGIVAFECSQMQIESWQMYKREPFFCCHSDRCWVDGRRKNGKAEVGIWGERLEDWLTEQRTHATHVRHTPFEGKGI